MTGGVATKYYYAGGQRIAMRQGGTLTYMFGDHLGSTSLTTDASGAVLSELRYTPWGEVRTQSGVTATKYQFTGQYSNASDFGLLYYNARWLDPQLGRFTSADSIVPAGVQGYDRYAYVNNSPVNFVDPSGHTWTCTGINDDHCSDNNDGHTSGMIHHNHDNAPDDDTPSLGNTFAGCAIVGCSSWQNGDILNYTLNKNTYQVRFIGYDQHGQPIFWDYRSHSKVGYADIVSGDTRLTPSSPNVELGQFNWLGEDQRLLTHTNSNLNIECNMWCVGGFSLNVILLPTGLEVGVLSLEIAFIGTISINVTSYTYEIIPWERSVFDGSQFSIPQP